MDQITEKPLRVRQSQKEIEKLLYDFKKMQVPVKHFCQMHSLGKATFHKWKSRYKGTLKK